MVKDVQFDPGILFSFSPHILSAHDIRDIYFSTCAFGDSPRKLPLSVSSESDKTISENVINVLHVTKNGV